MRAFTSDELNAGEYAILERIQTPRPGEVFDMNQLAVAAVLTMNTMIAQFVSMEERIRALEAAKTPRVKRQKVAGEDPPFKLTKLADEYEGSQ